MRKAVVTLLMLWLAAGYPLAGSLYARQGGRGNAPAARPRRPAPPEPPRGDLFAKFPVGEEKRVDLEIDADSLDGMSRRERQEQVRDWLLLTTVAESGVSLDEVNQALYDQPSVRHGYMQPLADFEYGETRSRYVGGGTVVALLPAGSRDQDDLLARVADQQRKDLGEIPSSLAPFEYRIDLDSNTALLVRRPTIPAADLFTEAYGYHQARVGSLADLNGFMARVDDVTYADASGGALTLGGRKIKGRAYGRIGVEEIAAVWQAQSAVDTGTKRIELLQQQLRQLNAKGKQLADAFDRRWGTMKVGPDRFRIPDYLAPLFRQEQEKLKRDLEAVYGAVTRVIAEAGLDFNQPRVRGAGFSLDPDYDYDRLAGCFEQEVEPWLRLSALAGAGALSAADITVVKADFARKSVKEFYGLLDKLSRAGEVEVARALQFRLNVKCRIQGARYDGAPPYTLQGTEAGMVLFYTDLVAKLWAINYEGSAPSLGGGDFRPITAAPVSPIHREELGRLSDSRLWFGPLDKGFQVKGEKKENLLLARNATRVYSASHDPLKAAAEETEANAPTAAFLNWWNDHYEEVARAEPQYERLNEIMKWSLLAGWLHDTDREGLLSFLGGVSVTRTNWFPVWAERHKDELKFPVSSKIKFYKRGEKHDQRGSPRETEMLPLLATEYQIFGVVATIAGGVSLGGRAELVRRLPLTARNSVGKLLRRAGLDLKASRSGEIKTMEGATHRIASAGAGETKVVSAPKPTAKPRTSQGELTGRPEVTRTLSYRGGRYEVETRVAQVQNARRVEVSAGRISVEETGNGFKVGRQARDMDVGLALARRVSGSDAPLSLLARSPDVEAAFIIPGRGYLIKTRGAEKWLSLEPAGLRPGAAQARVADLVEGASELRLQWLDGAAAGGRLRGGSVGVRLTGESPLNPLLMVGDRPRAAMRTLVVEKDGRVLRGLFDEPTGTAYFNKVDLPLELRNNPEPLSKLLNTTDLRELKKLAAESPGDIRYAPRAAGDFAAGLARADRFIAEGNGAAALDYLQTLERAFPGRWEVTARRGLAQLKRGKVEDAAAAFEGLRQNPATNLKDLYDQIASTLAGLKSGGRWSAADMGGGKFGLELTLPDGMKGRVVRDVAELKEGGAIYFAEGVNNPNASVQQVLMDAIARPSSGTVIKLRRSDIASYNPTVVHDPVSNVRFEFKGTTGGGGGAGSDGWAGDVIRRQAARSALRAQPRQGFFACCDDDDGDGVCNGDEEEAPKDDDDSCVYVVLPPGRDRTRN